MLSDIKELKRRKLIKYSASNAPGEIDIDLKDMKRT
jgi:hypothetical protein